MLAVVIGVAACASKDANSGKSANADEPIDEWVEDLNTDLSSVHKQRQDEVVCRKVRTVGSYVPKRVCRTRAQIEAEREAVLDGVGPLRPMAGDELKKNPN